MIGFHEISLSTFIKNFALYCNVEKFEKNEYLLKFLKFYFENFGNYSNFSNFLTLQYRAKFLKNVFNEI